MVMRTESGTVLVGDWRHRRGSKTDAHLYHSIPGTSARSAADADLRPICGKRIKRKDTIAVQHGRPCTDCLVNAIGGRDYSGL